MDDLLADSITRLRNGSMRKLGKVTLLNSKLIREVLKILKEEGYIQSFLVNDKQLIEVDLKYFNGNPVIKYINKISKCSRRVYSGITKLPRSKFTFGLFILSTNKGVMTHVSSRKLNVGGEILVEVA